MNAPVRKVKKADSYIKLQAKATLRMQAIVVQGAVVEKFGLDCIVSLEEKVVIVCFHSRDCHEDRILDFDSMIEQNHCKIAVCNDRRDLRYNIRYKIFQTPAQFTQILREWHVTRHVFRI